MKKKKLAGFLLLFLVIVGSLDFLQRLFHAEIHGRHRRRGADCRIL